MNDELSRERSEKEVESEDLVDLGTVSEETKGGYLGALYDGYAGYFNF